MTILQLAVVSVRPPLRSAITDRASAGVTAPGAQAAGDADARREQPGAYAVSMAVSLRGPVMAALRARCVRALRGRAGAVSALAGVFAVVAAALAAPAGAGVTPSSGDRRAAFAITFPARAVGLDLQLTAPRRCGELDDLHIAIRRARSGHFRFGPQVPGALPERPECRRAPPGRPLDSTLSVIEGTAKVPEL
jgi:hypothetical protein